MATIEYEPSRKLCEQYASSFYSAAQFLPEDKKNAAYALYGFCRYTDNIVDGEGSPEYKRKLLRLWKQALQLQWDEPTPQHSILHAFVHTCKEYQIPPELGYGLIEGLEIDLKKNEYENFDELFAYCYAAGGIPGLLMAHISGAPASSYPAAVSLGVGMQLTNILRDIHEDLDRGRVYVPLNEMNEYGYSINDLRNHTLNQAFRALMGYQIARAQMYYTEAEKALSHTDASMQLALELCLSYYREILREIEKNQYDVFSTRAFVSEERKKGLFGEAVSKILRQAERLKDPAQE